MQRWLTIGPWTVFLLSKSAAVSEEQLLQGAGSQTLAMLSENISAERRSDILRSRWCIRTQLGLSTDPTPRPDGDLVWPAGKSGSLSHKNGHIAVTISSHLEWRSVGIDLETKEVSEKIRARIITEQEFSSMTIVGSERQRVAAAFAIKEAIFKTIFPLTRNKFWFADASISNVKKLPSHTTNQHTEGYLIEANIGPRAGGPLNWSRICETHLQSVELDGTLYWIAICGLRADQFTS